MSNDKIEVFISYSKQDKELRDRLLAHLRILEGERIITWYDRQISPGTHWDKAIKARLNAADIILLLVSADFLNTDYCKKVEIPEALRQHEACEAIVMPVILRQCGWKYTPFANIQAYPEKAKPIKSWSDIDEAYTNVVDGVYLAATKIKERRSQQRQVEEQERLLQIQQMKQPQVVETERKQYELKRQWSEQLKQDAERRRQQVSQQLPNALEGNYAQLEKLLKMWRWEEADQETAKQMCEVMGRQREGWLRIEDIEQFPCADLRAINRLWVKCSGGKFGFSVQKKIWQECGSPREYNADWEKFGDRFGWRKGLLWREWLEHKELTFNASAPQGHLPSPCSATTEHPTGLVWNGVEGFSSLAYSLIKCSI